MRLDVFGARVHAFKLVLPFTWGKRRFGRGGWIAVCRRKRLALTDAQFLERFGYAVRRVG